MTDQRPESAIRPLELSLSRTRARIARANSRAISFLIGLPHVPPGAQPVVAQDAALLTYRATARWANASSRIAVLASSVYVRRDGRWKVAFHQQTHV
jgi:hypothetical protein